MNAILESFAFGGREVDVIDLSDLLSNDTTAFESLPHHIEYTDHAGTIPIAQRKWGMGAEYWREGLGWAQETVTLCTHSGTHIDAPYHYAPTSGGTPARTIEHVPLRWCMGDGFVLDMVGVDLVRGITQDDIERELERIDYRIKPYDIALIRTDVWKFFKQPGYDQKHPGMRESATRYLVDAGVKLIGIDAWGFDRTLDIMVAEAKAGDKQQLWEAHYFGAIKEYCQIEKLCHLDAIPRPHGFSIVALPVKLERASAGWSRVVAICPRAGAAT
jgi:kynurenine formamidase